MHKSFWALATFVATACTDPTSGASDAGADAEVLRGLADFHSHQFAHLGFAGRLHTHAVDPDSGCRRPLPFYVGPDSLRVADLVSQGLSNEAVIQSASGVCAPSATNMSGQQMSKDALERAFRYGLRLLVVLAVNSEFLCRVTRLGECPDVDAVEAQLRAARDLEAAIDAESGGSETGWYRIAETPAQARAIIRAGKLAVVLGVEASNAFGCRIAMDRSVPSVFPPAISPGTDLGPESGWTVDCASDVPGMATPLALARMEHYFRLGARHFFIVHNLGGVAGGNALSIPLLHSDSNPTRFTPAAFYDRVVAMDEVVRGVRPAVSSWNCSSSYDFDNGRCNKLGLTETGFALAKALAARAAMIDVDHLSLKAKDALRSELGLGEQYPLVSSHAGVSDIQHGDKSNEGELSGESVLDIAKWGGAFAPFLRPASCLSQLDTYPDEAGAARHACAGTSESFVQTYRFMVDKLSRARGAFDGAPAFVGLGFGSDFNGLAGWPVPRFYRADAPVTGAVDVVVGSVRCPVGSCYNALTSTQPRVSYPIRSPLTDAGFERSELPWSGRPEPYDISLDGVAHVGMIPDFVAELQALGLSEEELEPLWRGPEAYLRTWEVAERWSGSYGTEKGRGIASECEALRAELLEGVTIGLTGIPSATLSKWSDVLTRLRRKGCDGSGP